ncbi:MAG: PilZ domain-containing protein [Candidatus Omnitrophota bacterium]
MQEKRAFKRSRFISEVTCETKDKTVFTGRSLNISSKGIRIIVPEKLPIGEVLELELILNRRLSPLKIQSRVMWCRSYEVKTESDRQKSAMECGIQFLNLDNHARQKIFAYITRHETTKALRRAETRTSDDIVF